MRKRERERERGGIEKKKGKGWVVEGVREGGEK